MKLIGRLAGWLGAGLTAFCIATFLSQGVLLFMLWNRGYLTTEKLARLQAVMADVDYHKIRADVRQASQQAAEDPKALARNSVLKSQEASINQRAGDIALTEFRLREAGRRFGIQEEAFNGKVNTLETESLRMTKAQLVQAMKNMATDQVKANMMQIIKDGGIEDVLAVIRQMSTAEQTKIFSEFQTDDEKTALNEILKLMRKVS
ncbi:MAG: hypothetical protein Q8M16_24110 [Pirellulaceae bacterium]|nr:hypothetical protein [Pirellulaceae bacterium]